MRDEKIILTVDEKVIDGCRDDMSMEKKEEKLESPGYDFGTPDKPLHVPRCLWRRLAARTGHSNDHARCEETLVFPRSDK